MSAPRLLGLAALAFSVALAVGCRSNFVKIAPRPAADEVTGPTRSGTGCGVIVGFFPVRLNSRAIRAYRYATDSSRTKVLTDVHVTDWWFWTPIGLFLCTEIEGTLVPAATPSEGPPVRR